MNAKVERVRADESLRSAAERMREHDIGFLPVCDEHDLVVGALTDRDIVIRGLADGKQDGRVADCMTAEVISCFAKDDTDRAEELMALYQKSRIVILDDQGRLAGVISLADIARSQNKREAGETLRDVKAELPPSR